MESASRLNYAKSWITLRFCALLRVEILVVILSLRGELDRRVGAGLGIFEDLAFVVTDHDFFLVVIKDVTGVDRDFAAATGSVDDELGNAVAGGVATQRFDDLDALRYG